MPRDRQRSSSMPFVGRAVRLATPTWIAPAPASSRPRTTMASAAPEGRSTHATVLDPSSCNAGTFPAPSTLTQTPHLAAPLGCHRTSPIVGSRCGGLEDRLSSSSLILPTPVGPQPSTLIARALGSCWITRWRARSDRPRHRQDVIADRGPGVAARPRSCIAMYGFHTARVPPERVGEGGALDLDSRSSRDTAAKPLP